MADKGERDLVGYTAGEIREAKFKNELSEEDATKTVYQTAEFLNEREFDVWEFRGMAAPEGTMWRDALDEFWRVNHETGDIFRVTGQEED